MTTNNINTNKYIILLFLLFYLLPTDCCCAIICLSINNKRILNMAKHDYKSFILYSGDELDFILIYARQYIKKCNSVINEWK